MSEAWHRANMRRMTNLPRNQPSVETGAGIDTSVKGGVTPEAGEQIAENANCSDCARLTAELAEVREQRDAAIRRKLVAMDDRDVEEARAIAAEASAREAWKKGMLEAAGIAEGWKSPLRPGTDARLLGHQEAARVIALAIRAKVGV